MKVCRYKMDFLSEGNYTQNMMSQKFTLSHNSKLINSKLLTEVSEVKAEVKMEVNSLHSWKLKWTIVNEAASIQGYRPARSA